MPLRASKSLDDYINSAQGVVLEHGKFNVECYSGAQPYSAESPVTGTLLCYSSGTFDLLINDAGGLVHIQSEPNKTIGVHNGTIGWFRLYVLMDDKSIGHFDGSVGYSNGDLSMSDVHVFYDSHKHHHFYGCFAFSKHKQEEPKQEEPKTFFAKLKDIFWCP